MKEGNRLMFYRQRLAVFLNITVRGTGLIPVQMLILYKVLHPAQHTDIACSNTATINAKHQLINALPVHFT